MKDNLGFYERPLTEAERNTIISEIGEELRTETLRQVARNLLSSIEIKFASISARVGRDNLNGVAEFLHMDINLKLLRYNDEHPGTTFLTKETSDLYKLSLNEYGIVSLAIAPLLSDIASGKVDPGGDMSSFGDLALINTYNDKVSNKRITRNLPALDEKIAVYNDLLNDCCDDFNVDFTDIIKKILLDSTLIAEFNSKLEK